jgi:hypothetical protein
MDPLKFMRIARALQANIDNRPFKPVSLLGGGRFDRGNMRNEDKTRLRRFPYQNIIQEGAGLRWNTY